MSTDLSGRRAISAMQSPTRMLSSERWPLVRAAGRNDTGCTAMRALKFMTCGPLGLRPRKVSHRGLAVKRAEVNGAESSARIGPQNLFLTQDIESGVGWRTQRLVVWRKGLARPDFFENE